RHAARKRALAQPIDERLPVLERDVLPVTDDVQPEPAPRVLDAPVRDELDEVAGLLLVDVVRAYEIDAHGCGYDALFEVARRELESVAEELDDEVVPGAVVGRKHEPEGI